MYTCLQLVLPLCVNNSNNYTKRCSHEGGSTGRFPYGENLIAPCSQVHDNFTMGVNRKILINLIYLFIQETYLTCANGL